MGEDTRPNTAGTGTLSGQDLVVRDPLTGDQRVLVPADTTPEEAAAMLTIMTKWAMILAPEAFTAKSVAQLGTVVCKQLADDLVAYTAQQYNKNYPSGLTKDLLQPGKGPQSTMTGLAKAKWKSAMKSQGYDPGTVDVAAEIIFRSIR